VQAYLGDPRLSERRADAARHLGKFLLSRKRLALIWATIGRLVMSFLSLIAHLRGDFARMDVMLPRRPWCKLALVSSGADESSCETFGRM
jgi:hypothetical protein